MAGYRRKLLRWAVPSETNIIYRRELYLAVLYSELSSKDTEEERRAVVRQEIRAQMALLKKRNRQHSSVVLKEKIQRAAEAIRSQRRSTVKDAATTDEET
jgi:hypothetical protein